MNQPIQQLLVEWSLEEAIACVRLLETNTNIFGYHLALTGSVLYKGSSKSDLDLVCYPHSTERCDRRQLMKGLSKDGIVWLGRADHSEYGDDKLVEKALWQNKNIDFFFLL